MNGILKMVSAAVLMLLFLHPAGAREMTERGFQSEAADVFEPEVETRMYAHRDTCDLSLDFYKADPLEYKGYTIVYVFGGGFITGHRAEKWIVPYFKTMAGLGYNVAAIDYRLGLKGVKISALPVKQLEHALELSTEDLFSSVRYLIDHKDEFGVDPGKIIIEGSSAGAITSLQADYLLSNRMGASAILPEGFRFAGVISFSGAVFSREGRPDYRCADPAPTLFFHGTEDRLVPYKKIRFANLGFFGTDALVKRFEKYDYPYSAVRVEGVAHEVAGTMASYVRETVDFIEDYLIGGKKMFSDRTVYDPTIRRYELGGVSPSEYFKDNEKKK